MGLPKTEVLISVSDYLEGELISEIKHEYIGGTVHAMAGGKNRHNQVSVNSLVSLGSSLKGKACRPFNSDTKVRIGMPNQIRFYYPDVVVVCDPLGQDLSFQDKPVVVIEVLSDSTRRQDLGEKRDAYKSIPSLCVILIIDPAKVEVIVDRRSENGGFFTEVYTSLSEMIPLPEISTELPLADIYEGISLGEGE